MKISWPCTHPRILPSSVASQVCKKSCNRSFPSIVHYRLNRLSKLVHLTHLSSLESNFIHYSIFWFSFALDIGFFLIGFSTCSSTGALPFHFIMVLIYDLRHWGIMLEIGLSSKSFWRNLVEVKFKFLQNISHYCNNRFAFHMPMFIIFVLSFNKLNITIHFNIKFMVIAYNQNFHFIIHYKKF